MTEEILYVKRGRRYLPWGSGDRWDMDRDAMQAGTCRLIYCPEPGHYRHRHDVTPDTAAFLAAAEVARYAMEQALLERARARPQTFGYPYTPEQQRILDQFRADMAAAGALIPEYWTHGTASEIAQAGIDAVIATELPSS